MFQAPDREDQAGFVTTRHEFLAQLHELLQPRHYLEIGVQTGYSLRLAKCPAIGIDPYPNYEFIWNAPPNITFYQMLSNHYFESEGVTTPKEDLVFIDGDHRIEQVIQDFANVEHYCCHAETLVVLDDVLPYTQAMGSRTMKAGDWSGDAWKIHPILLELRSDLDMVLVDVEPAGLLLVSGPWNIPSVSMEWSNISEFWIEDMEVPEAVIHRHTAYTPDEAIQWVKHGT